MSLAKQHYKKTAKSLDDQIALMRGHGVIISDEAKAKEYLADSLKPLPV